jgi:hypothetical protein
MIILPDQTWDMLAVEAIAAKMDESKRSNWRLQSGKVFFKHRRAEFHLKAAQTTVRMMVSKMQPVRLVADYDVISSSYSGPLSEILFFHLDGFLEATRASYDALLSFLISAKVVRHDSPSSINAFIDLVRTSHHRAKTDPPEIADLLLRFWRDTGEQAKNFRDCFTHHVTLAGPTWMVAVMMIGRTTGWTPYVPWPDNPDTKSYAKFTFDKRLDAIAYCSDVYRQSDDLLRRLVHECLVKWDVETTLEKFTFTRAIILGTE